MIRRRAFMWRGNVSTAFLIMIKTLDRREWNLQCWLKKQSKNQCSWQDSSFHLILFSPLGYIHGRSWLIFVLFCLCTRCLGRFCTLYLGFFSDISSRRWKHNRCPDRRRGRSVVGRGMCWFFGARFFRSVEYSVRTLFSLFFHFHLFSICSNTVFYDEC